MIDRNMPVSAFVEALTGKTLPPFYREMLDSPPTVQDRIDTEVRRRRQMRDMFRYVATVPGEEKTNEP